MAELKPVPSGYDSSALSSMLGYLANARKSHDNNPFMRTILDQQARDNKAEYLADADLTRQSQMDDNEYVRQMNMAALLQKDASERASRGSSMFTATDGAVQTAPLTNDQGMSAQAPQDMDAILGSLGLDKMLDPVKKRADIRKTDMDTLESGQNIAESQADMGQLTPNNIANPNREVTPNLDNMTSIINARENSKGLVEAAKVGQTTENTQPGYDRPDGTFQPISMEEAAQRKAQNLPVSYAKVKNSVESSTKGSSAKLADPAKDVNTAVEMAKAKGIKVTGSGTDANGTYVIDENGQRLYPRPRQK